MGVSLFLGCGLHADEPKPDLSHLQALTDQGDLRAETELGLDYLNGTGVDADLAKGFSLIKAAGDKGFIRAEYLAGYCLQLGKGVKVDPAQAFVWYKKAADDGYGTAQDFVGTIYHRGLLGQAKDEAQAAAYGLMAARQMMPSDAVNVAWRFLKGAAGPVDPAAGFCWALQAAEGGNAYGAALVARCYAEGAGGVGRNDELAWAWTEIADRLQFDKTDLRLENLDLQRWLLDRLDPESIGTATRWAVEYSQISREGGFVLSPNLSDPAPFTRAPSPSGGPLESQGESDHHIVIPVMIQGQGPFSFVLDTGAPFCVINEKLASRLNLPLAASHGDFQDFPSVKPIVTADYEIFGNKVHNGPFLALPLEDDARATGKEVDGYIGYDFLCHFVVEIDPVAHTLMLTDPKIYHPAPTAQELPFQLFSGLAFLSATFSGKAGEPIPMNLIVDTGGGGGVIFNQAFDREYSFASLVPKTHPWGADNIKGIHLSTLGHLASLSLGSLKIPNPMGEWDEGFLSGNNPKGVIGSEVWKCFRMALDYQNRKLYLEPNVFYGKPDDGTWSGLACLYDEGNFTTLRVFKVFPDSPAATAGFHEGDELISIDKETVGQNMREALRKPGDHAVTVRRGVETLELSLKVEAF